MVGGEPVRLARRDGTKVDLLAAELHLGARRLAAGLGNVLARHAEHARVPRGRGLEVGDLHDQMVQRLHRDRHCGPPSLARQRGRRWVPGGAGNPLLTMITGTFASTRAGRILRRILGMRGPREMNAARGLSMVKKASSAVIKTPSKTKSSTKKAPARLADALAGDRTRQPAGRTSHPGARLWHLDRGRPAAWPRPRALAARQRGASAGGLKQGAFTRSDRLRRRSGLTDKVRRRLRGRLSGRRAAFAEPAHLLAKRFWDRLSPQPDAGLSSISVCVWQWR